MLAAGKALAAAVAAVLELAVPHQSATRAVYAAFAFAFVGVTMLPRRAARVGTWLDAIFVSLVIASTGGVRSNYMGVGLVVAVQAGVVLGTRPALIAGMVVTAASAPAMITATDLGLQTAVAWLAVFPLAAFATGLVARSKRATLPTTAALLAEANRVLSALFEISRSMPSGLDVRTVAGAALDRVKERLGAPAGALLLTGPSVAVSSFGIENAVDAADLLRLPHEPAVVIAPSALRSHHACWLTAPVGPAASIGQLLAACRDHEDHDRALTVLRHLADETAIGIENARLFAAVRATSVDEERRRLARELHDGVVQSLTHVRFELEFLSRHRVRSTSHETARLARVVGQVTEELRTIVDDLESTASAAGLTSSLRSYLRDVNGLGGPHVAFEAHGTPQLQRETEAEVFRIVQEAVSNAVRHAAASIVTVSLDASDEALRIRVRDDGRGISRQRQGTGMRSMRERANRIGAKLAIASNGEGTALELCI